MRVKAIEKNSDLLGIIISLVCLVHCLLLPVVMAASAFTKHIFSDFHLLDYIFVGFAFVAVAYSVKKSSNFWLKAGLWSSFLLFAISIFLHEEIEVMKYISITASLILVSLHWINIRLNHIK